MSDLVAKDAIEGIVGAKRHPVLHLGRAVSDEEMFYILHSQACRDSGVDLRSCRFSVALDDHGIDPYEWPEDVAVFLRVVDGALQPSALDVPL